MNNPSPHTPPDYRMPSRPLTDRETVKRMLHLHDAYIHVADLFMAAQTETRRAALAQRMGDMRLTIAALQAGLRDERMGEQG